MGWKVNGRSADWKRVCPATCRCFRIHLCLVRSAGNSSTGWNATRSTRATIICAMRMPRVT